MYGRQTDAPCYCVQPSTNRTQDGTALGKAYLFRGVQTLAMLPAPLLAGLQSIVAVGVSIKGDFTNLKKHFPKQKKGLEKVTVQEIALARLTGKDKNGGSLGALFRDATVMGGDTRAGKLFKPAELRYFNWETSKSQIHRDYAVLDAVASILLYLACCRRGEDRISNADWKRLTKAGPAVPEPPFGQRNKGDFWHFVDWSKRRGKLNNNHPATRALVSLWYKYRKVTAKSRQQNAERIAQRTGRRVADVLAGLAQTSNSRAMREIAFFPRPPEMAAEARALREMFPSNFPDYNGEPFILKGACLPPPS